MAANQYKHKIYIERNTSDGEVVSHWECPTNYRKNERSYLALVLVFENFLNPKVESSIDVNVLLDKNTDRVLKVSTESIYPRGNTYTVMHRVHIPKRSTRIQQPRETPQIIVRDVEENRVRERTRLTASLQHHLNSAVRIQEQLRRLTNDTSDESRIVAAIDTATAMDIADTENTTTAVETPEVTSE